MLRGTPRSLSRRLLGVAVAAGSSLAVAAGTADATPTYHFGWVLTSPAVHLILWTPPGGPPFPAVSGNPGGWGGLAEQFLTDVAHDSDVTPTANTPNVFTVMQQYYGLNPDIPEARSIAYDISFDGGFVDTQPYPTDPNCNDPNPPPGTHPCLNDSDLEAEVRRVITTQGNADDAQDVWEIATPPGVDVCYASGCSMNMAGSVQCGYHNFPLGSQHPVYAVIPYASSSFCVGNAQQGPSDTVNSVHSADATLNVMAHETIEAISDPTQSGWLEINGSQFFEIADECANQSGYTFGPPISGSSNTNQVINGHPYWLQDVWSNAANNNAGACVPSLNWPLHAAYAPPGTSSPTGTPVAFDGSPSTDTRAGGSIVDWRWDFGDGAPTTSGESLTHSFARAGTYRVTLTSVDNSSGTTKTNPPVTNSITHTVTITDRPPAAAFTAAPSAPVAGQAVAFDGSTSADPDGTIATYAWEFGDGATAAGATPSHAFTAPGVYPVRLKVTDNNGNTGTDTQTIVVSAAPSGGGAQTSGAGGGGGGSTTTGGAASAHAAALTAPAAGATVLVRKGRATVTISCPAGAQQNCAGTVTLSAASAVAATSTINAKKKKRILVLGHTSFSVAPGHSAQVSVHISAAGLRLLAHGRRLRVLVRVAVSGAASGTAAQTVVANRVVTLKLAPKPVKRRAGH